MISSNITANVSAGESADIFNSRGNKNEVSFLVISSKSEQFVKDTPYVVEFPIAPTSMSCFYLDIDLKNPTSAEFKSIKANLKDKTATITTKDVLQQLEVVCLVKYPEVMKAKEGKLTFGSESIPFSITIEDFPLVTAPSAKTDKSISISGVSTAALSELNVLKALLRNAALKVSTGATCDLDIEGTKSTISVELEETTVDGTPTHYLAFDLSGSKIATGKKFSITCDSKMVESTPRPKGLEVVTVYGDVDEVTNIHVNSAASVGVAVAIIASAASIMSLFF